MIHDIDMERTIYWNQLAEIQELKEFFVEDFAGFKKMIEDHIHEFANFADETLDKFSKLRALEVTNGCTQWAFRRADKECLSVEQTRECMNLVMGFIQRQELYFPSEGLIEFNEQEKVFLKVTRSVYKEAFKSNIKKSEREFYASSTAQFIACGHKRIYQAMALVKKDYESLFSPYYIEKGQKYILRYLEAFVSN